MTEKDYWERFGFWRCRLSDIYTHIKSGMAETENPHCRKGIIVEKDADTESRLDFVKDYLNVSELEKAGKVSELTIDASWTAGIVPSSRNEPSRDCWNKIIAAAYKANDGLLILNVSNMKLFEHCWWHIKQLAKQEAGLVAWPPFDKSIFFDIDEFVGEVERLMKTGRDKSEINAFVKDKISEAKRQGLVPSDKFHFNGYVLIVLDGLDWQSVREISERDRGQFDAAMQFYYRVDFSRW